MKNKYQWFAEDDTLKFMKGFILKACEQSISSESIGEYLALALDGIIEAEKERELEKVKCDSTIQGLIM